MSDQIMTSQNTSKFAKFLEYQNVNTTSFFFHFLLEMKSEKKIHKWYSKIF